MASEHNKNLDNSIDEAKTLEELEKKLENGKIVKAYFFDSLEAEKKLKDETGANTRILEDTKKEGKCIITGKKTNTIGYIARSY